MSRTLVLSLVAVLLTALPVAGQQPGQKPRQQPSAPSGRCQIEVQGRDSTRVSTIKQPSGQFNTFIGGGFSGFCRAQNQTLVSDSAEYFGDTRVLHLVGNVHYTEPRLTLDSDVATYYMSEERVLAEGKVHTTSPNGTTLDGPRMDYYRAAPKIRPISRMIAPERPTINVAQKDSAGNTSEPMKVIANTVVMDGDSLVYASGAVEITRPDVIAKSDTAAMDSGRETARLMRSPTIQGRGDRPFTLSGMLIDLASTNRKLNRVLARGNAKSVSQDATLTADTLDFRLADGRLQRVFAWGKSRSRATNPTYDIVSDSMDVHMPEQRMREIRSIGQAFAQSMPDTAKVRTKERDWLRGDTIFAYFDSSAAARADTSKQPQLQSLVALGHASSFYQLAPQDTGATGPAINYVRGRNITVVFANRQAQTVKITDKAAGVYLEPAKPTVAAAESTAARGPSPKNRRGTRTP